uniref:Small ribosomal subunit protein uS5 n=1 Tax=uncultured euryarchaeote Rifle_16ft_4_minimus_12392 TaxID=1665187 RepID=A0A0H4T3I6_9EURY|nr:30S ribosomal protein S5P [uncultured euryarchaeote Rifle_16ft_4_minimus_12392]
MQQARPASDWAPKTKLGKLVLKGDVTTLDDALATGYPLREPEIVDILLPELEDEVLDVNMVQRMTDSGRRVNFAITCVIGNRDGFVGLGRARGKEVGPAIRRAIDNAKINIIRVKRGCGSWECGCEITLKPAPRGVGLAVGDIAKSVLRLGGITDAWGFTRGHTKTTVNYALAAFDALRKTSLVKVRPEQAERLKIRAGAEKAYVVSPGGVSASPAEEPTTELPEEVQVEGEDLAAKGPEEGKAKEGEDEG